jgi:hypothetical protein
MHLNSLSDLRERPARQGDNSVRMFWRSMVNLSSRKRYLLSRSVLVQYRLTDLTEFHDESFAQFMMLRGKLVDEI